MGSWGYYIYKPSYGAYGTLEWYRFDQGLLSADERLHSLTEETTSISANLNTISGDANTMSSSITIINNYITVLSADVSDLEADISALESYTNTISATLDSTITLINNLEVTTDALSSTLTNALSDISIIIEELAPLTAHDTKTILFPEYPGSVIAETPGGNNDGTMISDVDTVSNYKYNHYKWTTTSSGGAMQRYDIHVQWRVPDTFVAFYSEAACASLMVDMATSSTNAACSVTVATLQRDGSATTSTISAASTIASTWYSDKEGTALIGFTYDDTVLASLSAHDILNIKLTMATTCASWAKVGSITLRYTG